MNSLPLGRNGRLLMRILALLLMSVPIAEAKHEWPEGTMGSLAKIGLVIISILVGLGMLGTLVYLFRNLFGIPHESHTETDRRVRGSKKWLEYIRLIAGQIPATHPVDDGAPVRVPDLEKQLFEEPPALPVRFFNCLIRTAKSCYTSVIGSGNSNNENSRLVKGKAPEERIIPQLPPIPMATGEGLEIGVHHAIYPATAAYPSRNVTAAHQSENSSHGHTSAKIFRAPGEIGIHYASYKPGGASIKSTDEINSTTNKSGGKISAYERAVKNGFAPTVITGDDLTIENTHRNKGKAPERRVPAQFQIPTDHSHRHRSEHAATKGGNNADKTFESWNQHDVLSPPPQAHTAATTTKHADNPVEAAAASSHHAHLGPYKPGTICRYPVFQSASSSIADLSDTGSRKPVSPPASSSILNSSGTICRYPVVPSAPSSILHFSRTICRKPVLTLASSSILSVSDAIYCNPVFPPASSSILHSSGTICRYPVFTSESSSVINSSSTICRYPDIPSATSSILNFSGTMCRKPVLTPASFSILSVSDAICCKPVSHT